MSAYGFDDDQVESLRAAVRERLNRIGLTHPHKRLPFPPASKGKDVTVPRNTADATLESFQSLNNKVSVN